MTRRHFVNFAPLLAALGTVAACLPTAHSKSDEPVKAEKHIADSMLGEEAGQVRDDNAIKMKFVWCPPGVFIMGDTDEGTTRGVMTRGYWLGRYEVTQAEW